MEGVMSNKISRRDLLKFAAASAETVGAGLVPSLRIFAAPPRQDTVTLRFQEDEKQYSEVAKPSTRNSRTQAST